MEPSPSVQGEGIDLKYLSQSIEPIPHLNSVSDNSISTKSIIGVKDYANRKWKVVDFPRDDIGKHFSIKIAHWNILAQKLSSNYAFPHVEDKWLQWNHRYQLIKAHIQQIDADILGISEFDCLVNTTIKFGKAAN